MSRKYIRQQILQDFVYPNNDVPQYDVEIVQDINNNCVDGTINSFSATTFNATGITFSLNASFILNGAEPFNLQDGGRSILSVHMMGAGQSYFKPWRLVKNYTGSTTSTGTTIVSTFTVIPAQLGLASFTNGVYYFEFRFIGHKCVLPICYTLNLSAPTPTPTPTVTSTPTPTPTGGPITPTPTPTSTPSSPCYCYDIVVTGSTLPPPEGGVIATLDYNDCNGVRTVRAFTVGPGTYKQCIQRVGGVVQYFPEGTEGIDESYLIGVGVGNCNTGYVCTGYTPAITPTTTPTGTPTPTPTGTPTPTPTASPVFTYLAACSGGTILGYMPGEYTSGLQVTIDGNCFVTATNTTSPTGTLYSGTPTFGACCPTATPTPTPTSTPTPTPAGGCVTSVSFEVDSPGTVTYYNCCGTPITNFFGIGPQVINDCITNGSVFGSGAIISFITYGSTPCSCVTPTPTPTSTSTPTPTPTATGTPSDGNCFCYTYTTVPSDLYVRYRDINGNVQTELIQNLETMDNGNGTFTACICVYPTGTYSTPVCVQGGIEVTCPDTWVQGGTCTTAGTCFLG